MSYELAPQENIGAAARRILTGLVDHVHALMTEAQPSPEEAVHEARKSFKRLRAVLRLMRDETGAEWYRHENRFYRDASRLLAPVRDSAVLLLTLDALSEEYAGLVPPQTFAPLRRKLAARHELIVRELLDDQLVMHTVAERMVGARRGLAELPAAGARFAPYGRGLRRVYARGRRMLITAAAHAPNGDNFHEWRKQVKYLWYQLEILQPMRPDTLGAFISELHLLSDYLGDAHDLVDLRETLLAEAELFGDEQNLTTLLALADRRRRQLEEASLALGRRLYAERPRAFTRRIASFWETWQGEEPSAGAG